MSLSETIFLFVLALVFFGPKKLPEIARTIGKYMNEFKRASNEFKAQIEQEISNLEVTKESAKQPAILPPSAAPAGVASRTLTVVKNPDAGSLPTPLPSQETSISEASEDEPLFAGKGSAPSSASAEPAVQSHEAASPSSLTSSSPSTQESHV